MTTRITTAHTQRDPVFAAIFPAGYIRPSDTTSRFHLVKSSDAENVQTILENNARVLLGIGHGNNYSYGRSRPNGIYNTLFIQSSPIRDVQEPDTDDRLHQDRRLSSIFTTINLAERVQQWYQQFGPAHLKKVLAVVVDNLITEFVDFSYANTYSDEVLPHLRFWVEFILATHVRQCMALIDASDRTVQTPGQIPTGAEVDRLQDIAMRRLVKLRVSELFSIIVDWPQTEAGIDDIRLHSTSMASRAYITTTFTTELSTRLLHPGASTTEILQFYVSMIRAFRTLDPRGVLLQRVDRKVRRYLREREDTIKIVVAGLLSGAHMPPSSSLDKSDEQKTVLHELAFELQHRDTRRREFSHGLDWNNIEWQPDPIGAAADFKSSRSTDIINTVISLFESKDVFVREFQAALAERLLLNQANYDQETSVLEHLKIRFGDAALQACEVMLRDVVDSRKLDKVIRQDQGLSTDGEDTEEPSLHAKILSRLFWPSLPALTGTMTDDPPFRPPLPILHQRQVYEKGFETLKQSRKISWNDSLGQVELELTFEDGRMYAEDVLPYQAAVIYAFNTDAGANVSEPVSRTVSSLARDLSISPALARSACLFFVSKQVLAPHLTLPDTFIVLEHLPTKTTVAIDVNTDTRTEAVAHAAETATNAAVVAATVAARQAEIAAAQAQREAEAEEKKQQMQLYHQFVTSMLTNQGQMPLARIAMMLNIVVPGGFPFSNEELKEFLGSMVKEGVLVIGGGGNYKISS